MLSRGVTRVTLVIAATLVAPAIAVGFGSFGSPETVPTGGTVFGAAVGDVTGDGKADVVATNPDHISVLPGKGNGKFKAEVPLDSTETPEDVAIAKLDDDNRPDLAVANFGSGSVSLFLGKPGGDFADGGILSAGPGAWRIAIADLNRDGTPDIVTGNYNNVPPDDAISVMLGEGDGAFEPAVTYDGGAQLLGLAVGRVDGDNRPDVVTISSEGLARVYLANADGTLDEPEEADLGTGLTGYDSVALADFNGDGKLDAAAALYDTDQIAILPGRGDGRLKDPILKNVTGVGPNGIAAGDLNRDGKADVAVAGYSEEKMVTLLGKGNGKLKGPRSKNASDAPESVALGRLNGDSALDVIIGNDSGVDAYINK